MKITTLLGSARKTGNTATILSWIEDELKGMGHQVDHIYLHNKEINGCLGCRKCTEKTDQIGCVQHDDANDILEGLTASDAVLFASPIYFWGFTTQLKGLMDRAYALTTNYHKPDHDSLMKGKRIGLLTTGGSAFDNNAEGTFTAFDRFAGFLLAENAYQLHVGKCSAPDAIPAHFKAKAAEFAKALVA